MIWKYAIFILSMMQILEKNFLKNVYFITFIQNFWTEKSVKLMPETWFRLEKYQQNRWMLQKSYVSMEIRQQ